MNHSNSLSLIEKLEVTLYLACLRFTNFTVDICQSRKACWEVLTGTCVGLQGPTVLANTVTHHELKFL